MFWVTLSQFQVWCTSVFLLLSYMNMPIPIVVVVVWRIVYEQTMGMLLWILLLYQVPCVVIYLTCIFFDVVYTQVHYLPTNYCNNVHCHNIAVIWTVFLYHMWYVLYSVPYIANELHEHPYSSCGTKVHCLPTFNLWEWYLAFYCTKFAYSTPQYVNYMNAHLSILFCCGTNCLPTNYQI